jgi:large subunit ribosomal protein L10
MPPTSTTTSAPIRFLPDLSARALLHQCTHEDALSTPYSSLTELFTGPTAIAYSADPVAAPRAAVGFAKQNENLVIIGGALQGNLLSAAEVRALAELPSLDELRGKLVGLLATPAARLVGVLQAPGGQLARVLAAHAEQA